MMIDNVVIILGCDSILSSRTESYEGWNADGTYTFALIDVQTDWLKKRHILSYQL
jgi:hypothetical protein